MPWWGPGPALDAAAVTSVVAAAAAGRWCVVPHQVLGTDVPDDLVPDFVAAMPPSWVRVADGAVAAVDGRPPVELGVNALGGASTTVTRLYHLQRSPRYRGLTEAVYDPLEDAWPGDEPWLERDAGFFVSSADGVSSAHADRHHNILLQLTGSKQIGLSAPGSRTHARTVARSVPGLRISSMPAGSTTVVLEPGQALYMPPYTLHWVRSLEASVAVSAGWSSGATVRAGEVHAANGALVRVGIPAAVVGGRTDGLRLSAADVLRRAQGRLLRTS